MKNFQFILVIAFCLCVGKFNCPLIAQTTVDTPTPNTDLQQSVIQLSGLVTAKKKYSFSIERGGTEYSVKLDKDAVVGLKMNKPWIDWEKQQVVVDELEFDADSDSIDFKSDSAKRVALALPAEQLFIISRLGDAAKVKQFKSADIKRLNFYLVTPEKLSGHFPSVDQPYLSGPLIVKQDQIHVDVDDQSIPVRLGFRYATMNGFSIAQLEPNKTQVFLTGVWAEGESEILATRILFQPVAGAQDAIESPKVGVQAVFK